jgi:hypothetical protein
LDRLGLLLAIKCLVPLDSTNVLFERQQLGLGDRDRFSGVNTNSSLFRNRYYSSAAATIRKEHPDASLKH